MRGWVHNLLGAGAFTVGAITANAVHLSTSSALLGFLMTAAITGLLAFATRRR